MMQQVGVSILQAILILALVMPTTPLRAQSAQLPELLPQQVKLVHTIKDIWHAASTAGASADLPTPLTLDEMQVQFAQLPVSAQRQLLLALFAYHQLQRVKFAQQLPENVAPQAANWMRGYNSMLNQIELKQQQQQWAALAPLPSAPLLSPSSGSRATFIAFTALASLLMTYVAILDIKAYRNFLGANEISHNMIQNFAGRNVESIRQQLELYQASHPGGLRQLQRLMQESIGRQESAPPHLRAMRALQTQLHEVEKIAPALQEIISTGCMQINRGRPIPEVIDLMQAELRRWQKVHADMRSWFWYYHGLLTELEAAALSSEEVIERLQLTSRALAESSKSIVAAKEVLQRAAKLLQTPNRAALHEVMDMVLTTERIDRNMAPILALRQPVQRLLSLEALKSEALYDTTTWQHLHADLAKPVNHSTKVPAALAVVCWAITAILIIDACMKDDDVSALDDDTRQSYQKLAQLPTPMVDAAQIQQSLIEVAQQYGQALVVPHPFNAMALLQEILQ